MTYRAVVIACLWLVSACGSGGEGNGGAGSHPPNVLTVTLGGSGVCTNVNRACTQVTICQPGTSTCQTISDILVDTGSFGVRIFGSLLSFPLQQEVESPGHPIGECMSFADGSALWGPVQLADVVLAGEPAVTVPIHVIASTFAGQSSSQNPCNSVVDSDPLMAGFNGILGIGLFAHDCGIICEINDNNNRYFSCAASTCGSIAAPLSTQVQNPVWLLPSDKNGVILTLPNVPAMGAPALSGSVTLGIGTASNNSPPPGISTFSTDQNGSLTTIYNGTTFTQSIIDSGSNGYFFPDSTLPVCPMSLQDFYCPSAATNLSATLFGVNARQAVVPFQVANAANLLQTGNAVFNNLGGLIFISYLRLGTAFLSWACRVCRDRRTALNPRNGPILCLLMDLKSLVENCPQNRLESHAIPTGAHDRKTVYWSPIARELRQWQIQAIIESSTTWDLVCALTCPDPGGMMNRASS